MKSYYLIFFTLIGLLTPNRSESLEYCISPKKKFTNALNILCQKSLASGKIIVGLGGVSLAVSLAIVGHENPNACKNNIHWNKDCFGFCNDCHKENKHHLTLLSKLSESSGHLMCQGYKELIQKI